MSEWVRHKGHPPPPLDLNVAFERCARGLGATNRSVQIHNHYVNVNRRPMPAVIPHLRRVRRGSSPGLLGEEIDWRRGAKQLDPIGIQPPPDRKSQASSVEFNSFTQVIDINADA